MTPARQSLLIFCSRAIKGVIELGKSDLFLDIITERGFVLPKFVACSVGNSGKHFEEEFKRSWLGVFCRSDIEETQ